MGVIARLVLFAPDEAKARSAARAAFARIAHLDSVMSDYRTDSELMRLVARPHQEPVPISEDLFRVLSTAQGLAQLSDGAFDVTAGPLVRLWREARTSGSLPHPDRLAAARGRTGWQHLRLDPTERTASLLLPGMQLDLGGIGKGYAADAALAVLRDRGIERALVELGGDIAVGAPPPGETAWLIRIADAEPGRDSLHLAYAAISSSGDTEQFVSIDGVRYSHVLDPRTGHGLTHGLLVTVTAPSATLSDALSTLIAVVGAGNGISRITDRYPEAGVYIRAAPHPPASPPLQLPVPAGADRPYP